MGKASCRIMNKTVHSTLPDCWIEIQGFTSVLAQPRPRLSYGRPCTLPGGEKGALFLTIPRSKDRDKKFEGTVGHHY